MLTRVELLRVSRNISLPKLHAEVRMSRQNLLRIRTGAIEPRRDMIAALVSAFRHLTMEDIQPDDVIELSVEESGPWRKLPRHRVTADLDAWRRERDAAGALLEDLRRMPHARWRTTVERSTLPIDGVVRALIFEARAIIDAEPVLAEQWFAFAADLVPTASGLRRPYHQTLIGRAWLELANAQRQLGKYGDALATIDTAERYFEGEPYATKELGRAWLARGTILFKTGRLDDAERSLRRAVNIFAAVDDGGRIARVRLVEGGIHFERGHYDRARDVFLAALPALAAAQDRHSTAVAILNVGLAETELGDAPAARASLEKALTAFERLRNTAESARTRWALGRLTALYEDRKAGLRALAVARTQLLDLGLTLDGAMVSLDIAEALLLPPRRLKVARELCARLPALFERAGATREAMRALAYLRDASETGALDLRALRHVRLFVFQSDGRDVPFVPEEPTT